MSTWFLCQGKGISYNITTNINPIFTEFYTSQDFQSAIISIDNV